MIDIPIIIPAYEPDAHLPQLCRKLNENTKGEIVLVNDGCDAKFDAVFEECCPYCRAILKHAVNLGKGRALKTAFNYVLVHFPDAVGCVTADSDGQHTPEDIQRCAETLSRNVNSLVLGSRDFSGDHIPNKSKFGNRLTQKMFRWLCGIDIKDTQTGLRAIPRKFMAELLSVPGERFEYETSMLIDAKGRYEIIEVPISTIYDSKENHRTHFNPVIDSLKIYSIFGRQLLRFFFSSVSSFVLDVALFAFFCSFFKTLHLVLYITAATTAARVISAVYNYLVNYKLVFKSVQRHGRSAVRYFVLALVQLSLSALFVTLGVRIFSSHSEVQVKIVVDVLLFFISYAVQRRYVF